MFEDNQRREGMFSHTLPLSPLPDSSHHVMMDMLMVNFTSTGKPVSHQFAKECLVGLAGAEVDKLAETKGMDYIDRERAKYHAQENVQNMYDSHYVDYHGADQYDP